MHPDRRHAHREHRTRHQLRHRHHRSHAHMPADGFGFGYRLRHRHPRSQRHARRLNGPFAADGILSCNIDTLLQALAHLHRHARAGRQLVAQYLGPRRGTCRRLCRRPWQLTRAGALDAHRGRSRRHGSHASAVRRGLRHRGLGPVAISLCAL